MNSVRSNSDFGQILLKSILNHTCNTMDYKILIISNNKVPNN